MTQHRTTLKKLPIESVPDYPTFVCDVCSKPVPRSYKFQHNTTNHRRCCYCMYFTKDFKENLNDHLLSVHPEKVSESNPNWIESMPKFKYLNRKFENAEVCCPHCQRFFKKTTIFKHLKVHQVKCLICQSVQATKEELNEHMKTNHTENIE